MTRPTVPTSTRSLNSRKRNKTKGKKRKEKNRNYSVNARSRVRLDTTIHRAKASVELHFRRVISPPSRETISLFSARTYVSLRNIPSLPGDKQTLSSPLFVILCPTTFDLGAPRVRVRRGFSQGFYAVFTISVSAMLQVTLLPSLPSPANDIHS